MSAEPRLAACELSVKFDRTTVLDHLSVGLPDGQVTAIVGPNACGKSTLLRSLARLQKASSGQVILDGQSIAAQNSKSIARRLAILSQSPVAPEGRPGSRAGPTSTQRCATRSRWSALSGLSGLESRPLLRTAESLIDW